MNRPHLVFLALNDTKEKVIFCEELVDYFRHAGVFSSLDFSGSFIWDGLSMSVAEANIPLKRLVLSCASGYSINGIWKIVLKHWVIEDLDLQALHFLTDHNMSVICKDFQSDLH